MMGEHKPIGAVTTSKLSEEELLKYRIGAKCDIEDRPKDWRWRSKNGWETRWGKRNA